jgi:hypothetical protein
MSNEQSNEPGQGKRDEARDLPLRLVRRRLRLTLLARDIALA